MKIKKIEVANFRSHQNLTLTPMNNLIIITGSNGCGKTSILEIIYYICFGKSFKEKNELNLIKYDCSEFVIRGIIQNNDKENKFLIYVSKNERKFYFNDKLVTKLSQLNKYINVLLFEPKMVELFKNSSIQKRRNYLDLLLSKQSDLYLNDLKTYKKILKERNELLKQEVIDRVLLTTFTRQLCEVSKRIDYIRENFINKINKVLNDISKNISNNSKHLEIIYNSIVKNDDKYIENLAKLYKEANIQDIKEKTTTIGIHKEDYKLNIDDKDIGIFGSQAENRLGVLSFVLSPYFILKKDVEKPIILLDDVLSELDKNNQIRLLEFLKKLNQVFITSTSVDEKYQEFEVNIEKSQS